jgi:ferredoxin
VKDHPELLPYEDLREILKNAPEIGVVDCPCRWLQVQRGECDKPTFVCLSLTPGSVKYIVDRGIGNKLTLEEGYKVLEQCEEAGLIPTTGGSDKVRQLCFCETDECIILRAQSKYGYHIWEPSRFQAAVDADLCTGCETCRDRCQFDAVAMEAAPESGEEKATVDPGKCLGCGVCAVTCPTGAMAMSLVRPVEHIVKAA